MNPRSPILGLVIVDTVAFGVLAFLQTLAQTLSMLAAEVFALGSALGGLLGAILPFVALAVAIYYFFRWVIRRHYPNTRLGQWMQKAAAAPPELEERPAQVVATEPFRPALPGARNGNARLRLPYAPVPAADVCWGCGGSGLWRGRLCSRCGGTGRYRPRRRSPRRVRV